MALDIHAWYRIPGYNGYEYQIVSRKVRSMKSSRTNPGKILKNYGNDAEGKWILTNDHNRRVEVLEHEIMEILNTTPNLVDGAKSRNLSPRKHLLSDGPQRTLNRKDLQNDKSYADFSFFFTE